MIILQLETLSDNDLSQLSGALYLEQRRRDNLKIKAVYESGELLIPIAVIEELKKGHSIDAIKALRNSFPDFSLFICRTIVEDQRDVLRSQGFPCAVRQSE